MSIVIKLDLKGTELKLGARGPRDNTGVRVCDATEATDDIASWTNVAAATLAAINAQLINLSQTGYHWPYVPGLPIRTIEVEKISPTAARVHVLHGYMGQHPIPVTAVTTTRKKGVRRRIVDWLYKAEGFSVNQTTGAITATVEDETYDPVTTLTYLKPRKLLQTITLITLHTQLTTDPANDSTVKLMDDCTNNAVVTLGPRAYAPNTLHFYFTSDYITDGTNSTYFVTYVWEHNPYTWTRTFLSAASTVVKELEYTPVTYGTPPLT